MSSVKLVSGKGKEFVLERKAVANINSKNCVNCNVCREACPVEAIDEHQRVICHACPSCTEIPGMSPRKFVALATERSCTTACPLGISPQGYVNLTKVGKVDEAYKLVWDKNPLPSVCARICHHPCESDCKRGILIDKPIAIKSLKRYLGEKTEYKPAKYPHIYEEKIAVIGAGPAGLTAGHYLSKAGYKVTIFEGAPEAGGMLKRGIPKFRLDRDVVDHEIASLEEAGLEIKRNQRISKFAMEKIKNEYDAVIVAAGTPNSKEMLLDGWRTEGIMPAMKFMAQVNNNEALRRHLGQLFVFEGGEAVIIGGGSVAIDSARAALRVGASKVTVVCLECGENVPAHAWELAEAKEEGIEIIEGYCPVRYINPVSTTLTGVEFAKVTSFNKDATGKISFETNKEDTIIVKANWAVVAIGQKADDFWSEVSGDNVYFAGDISSNKLSVIDAMASGRKASFEVDARLRGRELKDPMESHELHQAPVMEKIYPYNLRKTNRPVIPALSVEERVNTFEEVEGCFDDVQARQEVLTCMSCGYQVVDEDKCIGCGICQKLCPKGDVITMIPVSKGGEA